MLIPVNVSQELVEKLAIARQVDLNSAESYQELIEQAIQDAIQLINATATHAEQDACSFEHIPNEQTARALLDSAAGKGVVVCENLDDMWTKLGV